MPKGYNSLNSIRINNFEIGICPVCFRRLTSECRHRTDESEQWYAALIVAETNTDITASKAMLLNDVLVMCLDAEHEAIYQPTNGVTGEPYVDTRAPAEIVDDVYQAEKAEGSDTSWKSQLSDTGFGEAGVM